MFVMPVFTFTAEMTAGRYVEVGVHPDHLEYGEESIGLSAISKVRSRRVSLRFSVVAMLTDRGILEFRVPRADATQLQNLVLALKADRPRTDTEVHIEAPLAAAGLGQVIPMPLPASASAVPSVSAVSA